MWPKRLLPAGVLVAFAIVATGCGAPITAETTAGSVEQPVETTSAETQESMVEGEIDPVQGSPENTATTTTTMPTLKYSQAWIEYQALELYDEDDSLDHTKAINNYMSSNPNDISTPMGALCWAVHELTRSSMIIMMRVLLDEYLIPYLMEEYGITSEQIGNPGPEATEAFLNLVSENNESISSIDIRTDGQAVVPGENEGIEPVGYTGEAESGSYEGYLEYLRLMHEFAGDGAEWSGAVQAVASPEMAAAFRAGEGLPPDVQVYADALVAFTKERVGREFDPSAESDDYYFGELSFPGLAFFMQAAKYHQDCKRAAIGDIPGMVDSSSTSTTTTAISPVVSTTTTTHPQAEEISPSTTGIIDPSSVTTTQPLVDDAVPSSSSTTVPASATTQPQVKDTSPSTTTVPVSPVDGSVTTTTSQSLVEEPVTTTLPQVEDTSPSATTTVPVPPIDDSVTTTISLPSGEGLPPDDDGESGLFDENGGAANRDRD